MELALVPASHAPSGPAGVVLNRNAGRVTRGMTQRVRRLVGEDHVFLTESPEHAEEVLKLCVEREYSAVFAGGGDGTVIDTINTLERIRESGSSVPSVGVLRCGTGNALARWVGAARPEQALSGWLEGRLHRRMRIRMLTSEGTLFPFGGLGNDAAVLNDYVKLKKKAQGTWAAGLCNGLSGYFLAGLGMTVPRYLRRGMPNVRVINTGDDAYVLDGNGQPVGAPLARGTVLYDGPATTIGASTSPLIGYGFKFFPFATQRPGHFHLRLLNMSPLQCVANIPAGYQGTMSGAGVHDFHVNRCRMVFDRALPFQLGGDAMGYRDEVEFGLSEQPVTLIGQA
jgi:diacylglycerol kinase family enzyme